MTVDRPRGLVPCLDANLGLMNVEDTELFMTAAAELRAAGDIPDLVLFLTHPKTVAVGLRDRCSEQPADLLVPVQRLNAEGIALSRSVRGGGITYHWPGQVVCYPVLSLNPSERNIPHYMMNLEELCIRVLADFDVPATRSRRTAAHVGLWWQGHKLVSMGVRVSNWVTGFGFAVNLKGDHGPSSYVRPCGINGVRLVTMEEILGTAPSRAEITESMRNHIGAVLGRASEPAPERVVEAIRSRSPRTGTPKRRSGWVT